MSQPAVHNPYLGSRISLISKAKIRYEGILYAIDTDAMTVALTKVRSFGTENRCPDRPIGPRDEIFEYIIFRGTDICDLNVCDLPTDRFPQDPAILSATPVRPNDGSFPPSQSPAQPATSPTENEEKSNQGERNQRNQRNNQNYENRRQGGNQNNQRFQNQRNNQKAGAAATTGKTEQYKEDFDFESANAEFESIRKELFENLKISADKEVKEDEEPESGEIIEDEKDSTEYYNKSTSFFDNISCEATDPHGERITRSAERKLNSETFGISGNNRGYGRRGGFNKRGGRDGYNNRGRGNYRGRGGGGGDTRNWRSGHDNRGENGNNQRGNWRNNNNQRGGWRNNNRGGGADSGNWRGGGARNNRGGWGKNRNNDDNQQQQQGGRQNRNNRNREWVDYEYDVSKARQGNAQEA